jgi:hypothetical protein
MHAIVPAWQPQFSGRAVQLFMLKPSIIIMSHWNVARHFTFVLYFHEPQVSENIALVKYLTTFHSDSNNYVVV